MIEKILIIIPTLFFFNCSNTSESSLKESNKAIVENSENKDTVRDTLLIEYDYYLYENDTLIQEAFIDYISTTKILFLLKSHNKKNNSKCELEDTATLPLYPSDPDALDDEDAGGELYPAYRFSLLKKDSTYIYVSIEPSQGRRAYIEVSPELNKKCSAETPFTSIGTLRLKRKSTVPKKAPALPKTE